MQRLCGGATTTTAARAAIVVLLLPVAGCASAIERASANVPRTATPVVIDESIKALEDQATRDRLAKVMATPELQQAIRELASATIPGILDGLTEDESKQRVEAFARELVTVIARVIVETVRPAMHDAMSEALSKDVRATLDQLASQVAASAAHSAMRAAAGDIPTTVSPAMRTALAEGLASHDVRSAASDTAHDIARSAVLGSREALIQIQEMQTARGPIQRVASFLVNAGGALLGFALRGACRRWNAQLAASSNTRGASERGERATCAQTGHDDAACGRRRLVGGRAKVLRGGAGPRADTAASPEATTSRLNLTATSRQAGRR